MHESADAQHVGGGTLLGDPGGGELLRRDGRILGALAAVGGDHVVDIDAPRGKRGDCRGRAELGVVGVAEDHKRALQRLEQLFSLQVVHRAVQGTPD